MKPELRNKILAYNQAMAKNREAAEDLRSLLDSLPPGQVKSLLKEPGCKEILNKYGITG